MTALGGRARGIVYVVRHGETRFNREGRLQGRLESPLTALGRAQAAAAGRALRPRLGRRAPALWSSPQGRALATARILRAAAGWRAPIRIDRRLREVGGGGFEGRLKADAARLAGVRSAEDILLLLGPGAEPWRLARGRIELWLRRAQRAPRPVVVVTHGGSGRILRGLRLGLARAELARLETPQDAAFRSAGGVETRIGFRAARLMARAI